MQIHSKYTDEWEQKALKFNARKLWRHNRQNSAGVYNTSYKCSICFDKLGGADPQGIDVGAWKGVIYFIEKQAHYVQ